ncbi:NYN domain-containing protein [Timonella sp. A28]|uniref:NYN domain-containing protein n=1 Tax=Timonella sp. A28 TaxID=3442640 RepID=UPI003EBCA21C
MMNQCAVFVDAGFLHSVGAQRIAATSLRGAVKVQYSVLLRAIEQAARAHSGLQTLRTYWYDASKDGLLSDEHKKIAMFPGVKVRLGRVNYFGEQKGVDLRLALDLVGLARTGAASVAYLISGDDDLTEAVEEAQSLGMKVVLLGVSDDSTRIGVAAVADNLAFTVDAIEQLPTDLLKTAFTRVLLPSSPEEGVVEESDRGEAGEVVSGAEPKDVGKQATQSPIPRPSDVALRASRVTVKPPATTLVYSSSTGFGVDRFVSVASEHDLIEQAEDVGAQTASAWYGSTTQAELKGMLAERPQLPAAIDRVLIKDCAEAIGEANTDLQSVRRALRGAFWKRIDELQ